jgi:hypothetical protein
MTAGLAPPDELGDPDAFIAKPFDLITVEAAVGRVLPNRRGPAERCAASPVHRCSSCDEARRSEHRLSSQGGDGRKSGHQKAGASHARPIQRYVR